MISSELKKGDFSTKTEKIVKEILSLKDEDVNSSEFLNNVIDDNDSIKQFIKKI